MRALVTGSRGFVGSNLVTHLRERQGVEVMEWHRDSAPGHDVAHEVELHQELLHAVDV
ncbi:MAG: NAD-dependent epimerase/dehydratase family protein, partial [Phycisphaerales bacterium]